MRFITFKGKESFRMKLESDDHAKTGVKGNTGRFGAI